MAKPGLLCRDLLNLLSGLYLCVEVVQAFKDLASSGVQEWGPWGMSQYGERPQHVGQPLLAKVLCQEADIGQKPEAVFNIRALPAS